MRRTCFELDGSADAGSDSVGSLEATSTRRGPRWLMNAPDERPSAAKRLWLSGALRRCPATRRPATPTGDRVVPAAQSCCCCNESAMAARVLLLHS